MSAIEGAGGIESTTRTFGSMVRCARDLTENSITETGVGAHDSRPQLGL